jgi:hypothetical protein
MPISTRASLLWVAIALSSTDNAARAQADAKVQADAKAKTTVSDIESRIGMCDASAAVAVDADRFVVATDEDNILRVYGRKGSKSLSELDCNEFLDADSSTETDIEGATRIDNDVFWITSHGRNKSGKFRPTRYRFFATHLEITTDTVTATPLGKPYIDLLKDLTSDARFDMYRLAEASEYAPKYPGGLNIEGLAATPEGKLLIGFRNPIPQGKALLVPLENPREVIDGQPAKFGDPIELDFQNRGVRGIEYWNERKTFIVLAGGYESEIGFQIYTWAGTGKDKPVPIKGLKLTTLKPESIVLYPGDSEKFQIVSDDGTMKVGDQDCKEVSEPDRRSFRTAWIKPY